MELVVKTCVYAFKVKYLCQPSWLKWSHPSTRMARVDNQVWPFPKKFVVLQEQHLRMQPHNAHGQHGIESELREDYLHVIGREALDKAPRAIRATMSSVVYARTAAFLSASFQQISDTLEDNLQWERGRYTGRMAWE
jgi:hypothetical protein